MIKRITAAAVLLALLITMTAAAREAAFSDVGPGDWFYQDVTTLAGMGAIDGYPDGSFRPKEAVTRAEFCKLFSTNFIQLPVKSSVPWHAPYTGFCVAAGWIDEGSGWDAPMPRAEVAGFLSRFFSGEQYPAELARLIECVADYDEIPQHLRQAVLEIMYKGIMIGGGDGRYSPLAPVTRCEAATIILRVLQPARRLAVPIPALPVDGLSAAQTSRQIITVTSSKLSDVNAAVNVYEQVGGTWFRVFKDIPCVVGSRGMMYDRKQNSLRAPVGSFGFVYAFGIQPDPGMLPGWEYRDVTKDSYWVLDTSSPHYNRWHEGLGGFNDREHLASFGYQYNYALVIDFNYEKPVKGDGGAIFMHVATDDGKGTAGCIGLAQQDLLDIMLMLDINKNPRIIICPEADLAGY